VSAAVRNFARHQALQHLMDTHDAAGCTQLHGGQRKKAVIVQAVLAAAGCLLSAVAVAPAAHPAAWLQSHRSARAGPC
jgi:ABC-type lipoprotein export system ATPase subunit